MELPCCSSGNSSATIHIRIHRARREIDPFVPWRGVSQSTLLLWHTHSGRDEDKIANAGLSVAFTESDTPAIAQARLVLECKKLYVSDLKAENFLDQAIIDRWYPEKDFHRAYILQILNAYIKE